MLQCLDEMINMSANFKQPQCCHETVHEQSKGLRRNIVASKRNPIVGTLHEILQEPGGNPGKLELKKRDRETCSNETGNLM
jgi:hypothetical protein